MDQLEDILRDFATRIRSAVREEMIAALNGGGTARSAPAKRGPGRPPKALAAAPSIRTKPRKGGKRDPAELQALVGKLFAAIKSNPGQRIEEIGKAIGATTKDLALPAKKLIAEKKVSTKGNRRSTKYFPK